MGGPEVHGIAEVARIYLAAPRRRRPVLPVRLPGTVFSAFRAGANLAPDHVTGQITFGQFLAGRPGGRQASA